MRLVEDNALFPRQTYFLAAYAKLTDPEYNPELGSNAYIEKF